MVRSSDKGNFRVQVWSLSALRMETTSPHVLVLPRSALVGMGCEEDGQRGGLMALLWSNLQLCAYKKVFSMRRHDIAAADRRKAIQQHKC